MAYEPRKTGNADLDREFLALRDAIRRLEASARPSVLVSVSLTTADKPVFHRLGYPPNGVRVVKNPAGGVVRDQVTASSAPDSWIYVRATVAGVYTLEFF